METSSSEEATATLAAEDAPQTNPQKTGRRWFQLRISPMLALVVILSLPLAAWRILLTPAIHSAKASVCYSNLFKLYHAMRTYDEMNGSLPPACINGPDGSPYHSWRTAILPYWNSSGPNGEAMYQAYRFSEPWDGPTNRGLLKPVEYCGFVCPCQKEQLTTFTSYVVLVGPDTLFPGDKKISLADIPESVDPILVIEIANSNIHWTEPRDLQIDSISRTTEINSMQLLKTHAGQFRYITARGELGILPANTTITEIRRLAQSGIE